MILTLEHIWSIYIFNNVDTIRISTVITIMTSNYQVASILEITRGCDHTLTAQAERTRD